MNTLSTIYATFLLLVKSIGSDTAEVKTVSSVDLQRYMGRWYEISSYPQWFEKGLTNVSALYTAKNGYVEVLNSGYKDGTIKEAHGRAVVVNAPANSKLKVSFFRPFYGKYWIIDLATDYSWVVISNPKRSTLWIMCRTKTMDEVLYNSIVSRLSDNGFDVSKLVKMRHI